jgi:hypothetical protein
MITLRVIGGERGLTSGLVLERSARGEPVTVTAADDLLGRGIGGRLGEDNAFIELQPGWIRIRRSAL